MRDRLIELLEEADAKVGEYIRENDHMDFVPTRAELHGVEADHLLANDVIVPPCKVGDTVYRISKRYGEWCVLPRTVCSIRYSLDSRGNIAWYLFTTTEDRIGETVFLTHEEAEQALLKP